MERPLLPHKIRRLTFNNPKDGLVVALGTRVKFGDKQGEVCRIIRNENHYYMFGQVMYMVFVSLGDEEQIWKTYEGIPVTVEYEI